jgi:hypothetical protein
MGRRRPLTSKIHQYTKCVFGKHQQGANFCPHCDYQLNEFIAYVIVMPNGATTKLVAPTGLYALHQHLSDSPFKPEIGDWFIVYEFLNPFETRQKFNFSVERKAIVRYWKSVHKNH